MFALKQLKILKIAAGVFILLLFAACKSSKDDKFTAAIKEAESNYFKSTGEKVEWLEIDSLNYSEETMKDFYDMETNRQLDLLNQSRSLATTNDLRDSIELKKIDEENTRRKAIFTKLEDLMDLPSAANKVYRVNYNIEAKTDKRTYTGNRKKFLTKEGLKEIKLDASFFD